tara:strand:+ start:247 stop:1128 length:882 start_codon:yes stop_codon:yes gene_type:complete
MNFTKFILLFFKKLLICVKKMPELPEVEVTRRGIVPYLQGKIVSNVITRRDGLRWPFPKNIKDILVNKKITSVDRRGKYLLINFNIGTLIIHLGMSGTLSLKTQKDLPNKHDHFDLIVEQKIIRFNDPRRFGLVLWHKIENGSVQSHKLLKDLGEEPLDSLNLGKSLFLKTRNKISSIKQVLISGKVVVGIGNIYASESLFLAKINPSTSAKKIYSKRYARLSSSIISVLNQSIINGGSSLRDFVNINGKLGYFQQNYFVYNREGLPCKNCKSKIKKINISQRSTFFCPKCQK